MSNEAATRAEGQNLNVTVQYSAFKGVLPMAGKTVKQVREEMSAQWHIEAGASGYIGKQRVADDTILEAGQSLVFHRQMGEKGI